MRTLFPALAALGAYSLEDMLKRIPSFREGTRQKRSRTPHRSGKRSYSFGGHTNEERSKFICRQDGTVIYSSWITREEKSQVRYDRMMMSSNR